MLQNENFNSLKAEILSGEIKDMQEKRKLGWGRGGFLNARRIEREKIESEKNPKGNISKETWSEPWRPHRLTPATSHGSWHAFTL